MERFAIDPIRNQFNQPVQGAVAVRVQNATPGTGALATIYSDNGITPAANPVSTDIYGQASFFAADGLYDLVFTAPTSTQTVIWPNIRIGQKDDISSSEVVVGDLNIGNIQAAITAAGTTGSVRIPSNYTGTDTFANTNGIQMDDRRRVNSSPSRQRGYINMLVDCGLKGDGVTDDAAAANACFAQYPGQWFVFPQTATAGCSYKFNATLYPKGEGTRVSGGSGGFKNSNISQAGTVLCFAAGVSGIWLDMTPNSTSGIRIENMSLFGSEGTDQLVTPTKLNMPSSTNLPQTARNIATIQRTTNVLTVTTSLVSGTEGLTQQVGSTVLISGVVGDATMNGSCVIATLTGLNTFSENATGFTCSQNGADSGPFGAVGTVNLPTTGASTADGIRICSNFNTISNVHITGFGRHGINADSKAGHGCSTLFSDDLIVEDSSIKNNQGNGFFCQGVDCNAGTMDKNAIYYNVFWGVEDQSSLGNNWFGNQISNNGSQWASSNTPATKTISTIARTLTSGVSQVSVVLSVADTNLKLGSCAVIAGVTDSSFNTTAGQCFFVNSYTDTTHFGYEQPGAPVNASSSGGTSRMAKFSEAYLSAGIDSGAVKVGTQTSTYSQPWVGNYVEGGQACKFHPQTLITIGGANMPTCATTSTFFPPGTFFQNSFNSTTGTTITSFLNNKDQNLSMFFLPGKNGGTSRHTLFRWYNNNLVTDSWGLDVDPSGASGTTGSWVLSRGMAGSGIRRISFFGATNANGITRINSESVGAVQINLDSNSGTGGLTVCSGGVSPTCPASPSIGSDFGFFGPYFKSSTTNPAAAGTVRLAKSDTVAFRNDANGADVNGLSLDASDRVSVGGSAGIVTSAIPVPGPIGGTTASTVTGTSFISSSANPATSGTVRLALGETVTSKNFANNGNIDLISLDGGSSSNIITFGSTVNIPTVSVFNGITLVAGGSNNPGGVPSDVATVNLTAQTAAIGTTTLFTPSGLRGGQFRLSWNAKITTVAGVSSTLGPLTISYTDPDTVVQTITAAAQISAGTIATSSTANTTTTVLLGLPMMINVSASTAITYAFAYASNAANAMNYNLHIILERM